MSRNLKKQIEDGRQAIAVQSQQEIDAITARNNEISIFEFIGAAKLMNKITVNFTAQLITGLKNFQEAEGYKAYGCATWVEFLKQHPEMDMSKSKYYRLSEALESEGPDTFDLLNSINVPLSQRLQLTAGTIAVQGSDIIVGQERIPIEDTRKVKRAISQIVEQMERVEAKAEKTAKENEKLKGKLDDARAAAREAAATVPFNDNTDPANQAYMRVVASLTELNRELSEMDAEEAESRLASYRPGISQAVENCFTFSAAASPTRRPDQLKKELGLSDNEMADLMEE